MCKNSKVVELITQIREEEGIKLPIDYQHFGRSFDGIDYRFLHLIKEHFPTDYQKIIDLFPLAELEILKMKYREEYYRECT